MSATNLISILNRWTASSKTDLGYDDFFFKNFHGVIFPAGLFSDKNYFTKGSLAQQLQVVEVTHCLQRGKYRKQSSAFHLCFKVNSWYVRKFWCSVSSAGWCVNSVVSTTSEFFCFGKYNSAFLQMTSNKYYSIFSKNKQPRTLPELNTTGTMWWGDYAITHHTRHLMPTFCTW